MIRAVDDDPGVLDALRFALEASGWKIQTYTEPQKFLDELDLSQPGCLILDIRMPEMTGIESLKEIRKLSKDIPVIMQSAYVFDSDMEAAKEAGASGFITKPINLKVLKNTISQYCPSIVW